MDHSLFICSPTEQLHPSFGNYEKSCYKHLCARQCSVSLVSRHRGAQPPLDHLARVRWIKGRQTTVPSGGTVCAPPAVPEASRGSASSPAFGVGSVADFGCSSDRRWWCLSVLICISLTTYDAERPLSFVPTSTAVSGPCPPSSSSPRASHWGDLTPQPFFLDTEVETVCRCPFRCGCWRSKATGVKGGTCTFALECPARAVASRT